MRKKDEVFSKFVKLNALVEKETGNIVKALRSNNGGGFFLIPSRNYVPKKVFEENQ